MKFVLLMKLRNQRIDATTEKTTDLERRGRLKLKYHRHEAGGLLFAGRAQGQGNGVVGSS